jgi:uncharacterized protein (TIGR02246 family)
MKKIIQFILLTVLAVTAFINPLKTQDAAKELTAFTKKFEQIYNKKDDKALKEMYTKDATRTNTDGTVVTGNEAIGALFAELFKGKISLVLVQDKVVTADGITTATGNYHVTGTSAKGEKIDRKGIYTNTVVKENGDWKISKSVLSAL